RQRTQQAQAIHALEDESERLRQQAETILARYPEVEAGLARLASEGPGPIVELDLDGVRLPLRLDRSPRQSAQLLFDERKRVLLKLDGARAARGGTDAELSGPSGPPSTARARPPSLPTGKPLWFERYRWFYSSEGVLVIGGRDAASNDRIVKRYLGPKDRYVHADLHGAASVVVKQPENQEGAIGEGTMREAGQWAVAYSKAWRAGRGGADAFWVESEQVSKTPASGEFVARGSWVVNGTKHLLRDLPMELALGRVAVEGGNRWTVAPLSAIRARGTAEILLRPGEERLRLDLERELARSLSVSRDVLQSLLPAGGISVERLRGGAEGKGEPAA
ncbi:MAG: NFACT RNA binding domain-containing protein, partial [Thermoplasmata archaeon]|nr:NFACT RNA binding domain-containing protein [Thermoplasmata archaeon]